MEGLSPKSEGSELRPEKAPSVLINVRADVENEHQGAVEEAEVPWKKARKYLRWTGILMNKLTDFTGSTWTVFLVLALCVAWAIWGIFKRGSSDWQIVMQNFSSIQTYLWDLTLLNAQRCDYAELDRMFQDLICNSQTQRDLMPKVLQSPTAAAHLSNEMQTILAALPNEKSVAQLPNKSRFGRFADRIAKAAGSIPVQLVYIGGVLAWLAVGPMLGWSQKWQLYCNTAVALELTIMECFLQNTMRRHRKYLSQCSMLTETQDRALTSSLYRALGQEVNTGLLSKKQGFVVQNSWQGTDSKKWYDRWVAWYSVFMGSLAGILLTVVVFIVWAGIGALMGYGNPNWLLIIGTYTGLLGFFNAFVLRFCMHRMDWTTQKNAEQLDAADKELLHLLNVKFEPLPEVCVNNVFKKASTTFSKALGTFTALIGSIIVIIVLLIAASVLSWSETGQLLANTPTMIIEGFLLVFLMFSQVSGDQNMRQQLASILHRRIDFATAIKDLGTA